MQLAVFLCQIVVARDWQLPTKKTEQGSTSDAGQVCGDCYHSRTAKSLVVHREERVCFVRFGVEPGPTKLSNDIKIDKCFNVRLKKSGPKPVVANNGERGFISVFDQKTFEFMFFY